MTVTAAHTAEAIARGPQPRAAASVRHPQRSFSWPGVAAAPLLAILATLAPP
jgi:hypothetical protein